MPKAEGMYLIEKGTDPFPIQRMEWLNRIFFPAPEVFKMVKAAKVGAEGYPENLISLIDMNDYIEDYLHSNYREEVEKYPSTVSEMVRSATYNLTFMYNWNLYKQVYRFDEDLLAMLCNETDSRDVPVSVLIENLPYPSFFIDNRFVSRDGIVYRGVFISYIMDRFEKPELGMFFVEDNPESDYQFCFVPLYFGDQPLTDLMALRDIFFKVNKIEAKRDIILDLAQKVLNAIIYICSANKEIETVKRPYTISKPAKNKKKPPKKSFVGQNMVGYKMGVAIRAAKKRYIYEGGESTSSAGSKGKKKSPHLRNAHYHHFWTGKRNEPEKRTLIVKFIPPLYINGNTEEMQTSVHPVKK